MALRVGFIIDTLSLPSGGTEGQLVHLVEGLDRRHFEPFVYCLQPSEWLSHFDGAPATVLGIEVNRRPALLRSVERFARRLRADGIDILQTHFRDGNFLGVIASRRAKVPVLISTRRGEPYWNGKLDLALLRWLDRSVDCFIANSQATRARFAEAEGFDPARAEVIYNGLDSQRFAHDPLARQRLRAELEVGPMQPLVGIVANLRPVKGVDDFVRAAALVHDQLPQARFVVAGQGLELGKLQALAASLGLAEALCFLGARADVPQLLSAFDVGVLASHFESFSNAILEYLAAGLPVVVTRVGGAAEVVQPEHGFLVPAKNPTIMAERIVRLLAHPGGARAFRSRDGLPERFSMPVMIGNYESLYTRLHSLRANSR